MWEPMQRADLEEAEVRRNLHCLQLHTALVCLQPRT